MEQLSLATRARLRMHVRSTSSPGGLGLRYDGPRGRSAVPDDALPAPWAWGSTSSPGRLGPGSDGPGVCPAVPYDLRLSPIPRALHQLSRATRASDQGLTGSTNTPRPLAIGCEGPRGQPAVLGSSGPWPRSHVRDRFPGRPTPGFQCPRLRPALLGDSASGLMARAVDQHSPASRARVRRPAGSTNTPACLTRMSEGRGVDQLSRITRARARVRAGQTSCPGGLGLGSECLLVDQHFQATRARVQGPAG